MVTLRTLLKLQAFSPPTSAIPSASLTPLHVSHCLCYGSPVPFCRSHYPATISRTQVTGVNDLSGDPLGVQVHSSKVKTNMSGVVNIPRGSQKKSFCPT